MVARVIFLISVFISIQSCSSQTPATSLQVTIAGKTFVLEVARDVQSRTSGLMHRTSIPKDGGMLFIFPDSRMRSFWMKNCFVPIDLLFLDSRGTITALHEMPIDPQQEEGESDLEYERRLPHYWSNTPARFAIELTNGSIEGLNLRVNDRIDLDLKYLNSMAR
jgi:hypothetical protein